MPASLAYLYYSALLVVDGVQHVPRDGYDRDGAKAPAKRHRPLWVRLLAVRHGTQRRDAEHPDELKQTLVYF